MKQAALIESVLTQKSRPTGLPSSRPRHDDHWRRAFVTPSFTLTSLCLMTRHSGLLRRPQIIADGARKTCPTGSAMGAFEYRQAQEIRDCFQQDGIRPASPAQSRKF